MEVLWQVWNHSLLQRGVGAAGLNPEASHHHKRAHGFRFERRWPSSPASTHPAAAAPTRTSLLHRRCQREAWKQPAAHKVSCGCRLPTPAAIATGTTTEVATILHEFARADPILAEHANARLATLLATSSANRRDGHAAGAPAAVAVAMAAHAKSIRAQRDGCVMWSQTADPQQADRGS